MVTLAEPSVAASDVVASGAVFFSIGSARAAAGSGTVKATRKRPALPAASTSSPWRTCAPGRRAPAGNVTVSPEMAGAAAALPSSSTAVTEAIDSPAAGTTELAAVTTDPSAGAEETACGGTL